MGKIVRDELTNALVCVREAMKYVPNDQAKELLAAHQKIVLVRNQYPATDEEHEFMNRLGIAAQQEEAS